MSDHKNDPEGREKPAAAANKKPRPPLKLVGKQDGRSGKLPLEGYLERIGATAKSFRRHVIEVEDAGEYTGVREKATINIAQDGTIEVSSRSLTKDELEEIKPTEEEQKVIAVQVATRPFPKSVGATKHQVHELQKKVNGNGTLYLLYDAAREKVIMAQQRIEKDDGGKSYLPWSMWSDGEWWQMEPDGLLPFWKPHRHWQPNKVARIMIHEGAKAAAFIDGLVRDPERKDELARHPWGEELANYEHWGMIGGTQASHKADFDEVRRGKVSGVVYVCDNDQGGKEVAGKVSRMLGHPLKVVMFDDRFKPTFDLADEWPGSTKKEGHPFWTSHGQYKGPTMADVTMPATWATRTVHTAKQGRPSHEVVDHFAAEWFFVVTPAVFVHRDRTDKMLTESEFNIDMASFSDSKDTAGLLTKFASSKANRVTYSPADKARLLAVDGQRLVNTYRPPTIAATKGDPAPFLKFMEHLIPGEGDRTELLRWVATLIARPDIRMMYAVLLISEMQGVGKGTLGEKILRWLVGPWNTSIPDEQQLTELSFNSWLAHRRLVVAHEIYAGHSWKAYNKLKSVITDTRIPVKEKYLAEYEVDNWVHIYACSNSLLALKLDNDDRRWFVPRVTEETWPTAYWTGLNAWLDDGGLGIIRWWAEQWLKKNEPVAAGAHAPDSSMKREIVKEGMSESARIAFQLGEIIDGRREKEKIVVAVEDVRRFIEIERPHDRYLEKAMEIRKVMRAAGCREPAKKEGGVPRFQIGPKMSHVVANFEIKAGDTWKDLKGFYKQPGDLWLGV